MNKIRERTDVQGTSKKKEHKLFKIEISEENELKENVALLLVLVGLSSSFDI